MSKELEALDELFAYNTAFLPKRSFERVQKYFDIIEPALQRLEAIDNAKPNEALECLKRLDITIRYSTIDDEGHSLKEPRKMINSFDEEFTTIKKALIKAQEQEKVIKIVFEKRVDIPYLYELFECIKQGKDTIESALKQYNDSVKNGVNAHQLTQEEFDLLKRYFDGKESE